MTMLVSHQAVLPTFYNKIAPMAMIKYPYIVFVVRNTSSTNTLK